MEKILSIEATTWKNNPDQWDGYDGYVIKTDEQEIKIGISNGQSCCENFGYLTTNDSTEEFIGAELINIKITDTALNKKEISEFNMEYASVMFVDLETTAGVFQIVAYNEHNGYYGHEAVIISKQLSHSDTL